jgi:thioredoxin 1
MENKKRIAKPMVLVAAVIAVIIIGLMMRTLKPHSSLPIKGETPMEAVALDFKKDVLESPVPVLVDFWAPWCGPCRMIGPVIEGIAAKANGKAKVVKVNVDEHQDIAAQYGIQGIPTVMVFKKGEIATTLVGARQEKEYLNALGL